MTIKCDYGEPLYKPLDIVSYKGKSYIVIQTELNFDNYKYQSTLLPYDEDCLEYIFDSNPDLEFIE